MRASRRNGQARILLAPPHYPPSTTSGSNLMAQRVAGALSANGYRVSVFSRTAPPRSGPGGEPGVRLEGEVTVHRVSTLRTDRTVSRLIGGVVFGARLILHCANPKTRYDAVSVMTVPPVFMGAAGRIAARLAGAKLIYHCMDIHPEASLAVGDIKHGPAYRFMRWADQRSVAAADATVVLSTDMAETVRRRGHHNHNVWVINNFNPQPPISTPALAPHLRKRPGRYQFLFAGNISRFQGLESVLEAFLLARESNRALEIGFVGQGAGRSRLEALAGAEAGRSVLFWDQVAPEVAAAMLSQADGAIISLAPGVIGSAYPSKTMTCLEMGAPVLAMVERGSELARLVEGESVGVVAEPGDVEQIAAAMVEMSMAPIDPAARERIVEAAHRHFGVDQTLARWCELADALVGS